MLWQQLTPDQQELMKDLSPGKGNLVLMDEIYGYSRDDFMEIYGGVDTAQINWWKYQAGSFVAVKGGWNKTVAKQLVDLGVLTHVEDMSPTVFYVGISCPKGVALLWDAQHRHMLQQGSLVRLRGGKDPDLER